MGLGYRGWDVWKKLSGTVETSTCRSLTRCVIDGIRCSPKSREMRIEESEEVILPMMARTTKPHRREGLCFCYANRCERHCMIAKAQNMLLDKVRVLQRSLYRAAKANPTRKFGVLYDKVCRDDVLRTAYRQVKANGGAPGIDQQTSRSSRRKLALTCFCAISKSVW